MDTDTSQLKADIARTRADLGETIDAIGEKVRPKAIVRRRTERIKDRFRGMREKVMGAPEMGGRTLDLRDSIDETTGEIRERASDLREALGEKTSHLREAVSERASEIGTQAKELPRGNPLAAGIIAFGAGALAGSLLRPSEKEQQAAQALMERMEPVKDELAQAGREMAQGAKAAAREAADELKAKVTDAASAVAGEARSAGQDLKEEAKVAGRGIVDR